MNQPDTPIPDERDQARAFSDWVMSHLKPGPWKPFVIYDPENNCLEIMVSSDNFTHERIKPDVWAYVSRETGKIIGVRISGLGQDVMEALT